MCVGLGAVVWKRCVWALEQLLLALMCVGLGAVTLEQLLLAIMCVGLGAVVCKRCVWPRILLLAPTCQFVSANLSIITYNGYDREYDLLHSSYIQCSTHAPLWNFLSNWAVQQALERGCELRPALTTFHITTLSIYECSDLPKESLGWPAKLQAWRVTEPQPHKLSQTSSCWIKLSWTRAGIVLSTSNYSTKL